jgi:phospholipid transport system substrate-binding protein
MIRTLRVTRWLAAALIAVGVAQAAATAVAPDQIVRENTEKVIALIKANRDSYARDQKKLYGEMLEIAQPYFDFRKMSQLVLGRAWRDASEDQRARFTSEFRDLLVRAYSTVLLKFNDEQIVYLPFTPPKAGDRTTAVRIEVRRANAAPVLIVSDFYLTDAGWKVFDVTVDGVSLVTSYRTTYAERIRNEGIDALIAGLAKDNRSPKPPEPIVGPKS